MIHLRPSRFMAAAELLDAFVSLSSKLMTEFSMEERLKPMMKAIRQSEEESC
jgi:phage regulator Rha-like protein